MVLETDRLILRTFKEGDEEDLFEYLSEPMVHCFACMKLNNLEEAKEEVAKRAKETEYFFAETYENTMQYAILKKEWQKNKHI